jgi:hypothetical protein
MQMKSSQAALIFLYGFHVEGYYLILEGTLHLGSSPLKDTLTYDSAFLHFQLETPWKRINEGSMKIVMNELLK